MERYANRGGNSAVRMFEIGDRSIKVQFDDGRTYLYTVESAGPANIEAPMARSNCSTCGHPNCSRQDGIIMRGLRA